MELGSEDRLSVVHDALQNMQKGYKETKLELTVFCISFVKFSELQFGKMLFYKEKSLLCV